MLYEISGKKKKSSLRLKNIWKKKVNIKEMYSLTAAKFEIYQNLMQI